AEVVVIVIRDSLSKDQLEHKVVVFERRKPPCARKRRTVRAGVPCQVEHLLVRHDATDVPEESGRVNMAAIIFIAVKSDQIRKLRGADGNTKLGTKGGIRSGFLNGHSDGMVLVQGMGVPELWKPRRNHAGRTFKLQSVRKGIGIGKSAPSLS